jgi:hypothetical protein
MSFGAARATETRKRPNVNFIPQLPLPPLTNSHRSLHTQSSRVAVVAPLLLTAFTLKAIPDYSRRFCMSMPHEEDALSIPPTVSQHLATCYTNIIWMCLDSELAQSAVFFAERYYALDHNNHDARHIFVTALLHAGRKNSALSLLRDYRCSNCSGCQHLKSQTCNLLGRHREAREALETSLSDPGYVPTRESPFGLSKCFYLRGSGFNQPRCLSVPHQCSQAKPQENACQGI